MNFPNKIMSFSLFSLRESTIIALTVLLSWGLMAGAGTQCYAFQIIAFAGVILFGLNTKRFFWWLIFPLIVVFSLYFPVGFSFGPVSKGYISALIATTATETYDFLASTPFWHFIVPVILIASSVLLKTYVQREKNCFLHTKIYCALRECLNPFFFVFFPFRSRFNKKINGIFKNIAILETHCFLCSLFSSDTTVQDETGSFSSLHPHCLHLFSIAVRKHIKRPAPCQKGTAVFSRNPEGK